MANKKDTNKKSVGMIAGIILAVVCIIVCVIVAICIGGKGKNVNNTDATSIVGTWKYDGSLDYKYVFNADGTCSYSVFTCTYKDNGESIDLLYTGNTDSTNHKYRIEEGGKVLYIEDDSEPKREVKYLRQ